jgi:hypothetical protein
MLAGTQRPDQAIHSQVKDLSVLCGHENPFDGWTLIIRIIPLRIDSMVGVLATFIKVVLRKCKGLINEAGMLVRVYLTRRHRAHRERLRLCFKTLRAA